MSGKLHSISTVCSEKNPERYVLLKDLFPASTTAAEGNSELRKALCWIR